MKRYASYKASGVEWLGELPEHWTIEKLKFFVSFSGGGTPSKEVPSYWDGSIPWVSPKDMKRPRIAETEDYITDEGQANSPCALIPPQSVLTVVRSGILQHSIPVAINEVPVTLNQDIKALLPGVRVDSRFLAYQITGCQKELREVWVKQGATVESIEHQRMADSQFALPPLEEQQAIAGYLDAETARIDTLIQEKEGLIGLLREWRQSVIAEAVTKGLDERVAMKPSGVTWLGEVPEHWKIERLRFRVKLNPLPSRSLDAEQLTSFLPMEAIGDDGTLDLERTRRVGEVASGYTFFEDGDIAIAKITPCYENGKGAVMVGLHEGIGFGTTELIVMRPTQADCPQWLYYLTMCSAFRLPGEALMQGAGGQKRVPDLFVKDYVAPVPPLDEQQAIADYLDVETTKIDTLITHTQEAIALLKELRAATIADAVLGRVDVRQ